MTDTCTDATIAAALDEMQRVHDHQGRGCPDELWIARASLAALTIAARLDEPTRERFLAAAAKRGLYHPNVAPGWTLPPTDTLCAHGIEWGCCPAGCDRDLYDE